VGGHWCLRRGSSEWVTVLSSIKAPVACNAQVLCTHLKRVTRCDGMRHRQWHPCEAGGRNTSQGIKHSNHLSTKGLGGGDYPMDTSVSVGPITSCSSEPQLPPVAVPLKNTCVDGKCDLQHILYPLPWQQGHLWNTGGQLHSRHSKGPMSQMQQLRDYKGSELASQDSHR
jgi:hypothetical protein